MPCVCAARDPALSATMQALTSTASATPSRCAPARRGPHPNSSTVPVLCPNVFSALPKLIGDGQPEVADLRVLRQHEMAVAAAERRRRPRASAADRWRARSSCPCRCRRRPASDRAASRRRRASPAASREAAPNICRQNTLILALLRELLGLVAVMRGRRATGRGRRCAETSAGCPRATS